MKLCYKLLLDVMVAKMEVLPLFGVSCRQSLNALQSIAIINLSLICLHAHNI